MVGVSTSTILGPAILRAKDLGRFVNGRVLVENANFEVQGGEVLAVVGPSGSGKSSLLRLLNRLDEPTSGTVYLQGTDYRQIAARDLRRKVGMVTQRAFLFPGTVESNLRFGPAQRGESLSEESLGQLLDEVGREGANLSGGEAQRVSVARTLANSPLALLLDEPTSALDTASKLAIESLISKIVRDQKLTCVLVTHDMTQGLRLAQHALLLESGRIKRMGPANEVLHA
jgi:putative ABC transport system ATP-binding protein